MLAAAAIFGASCAGAATDTELDALKLQGEPAKPAAAAGPLRAFVEGAWGRASIRGGGSQAIGRASLDLRYGAKLSPNWRAVLSDRIDRVHPVAPGDDPAINTLREAHVGWQNDDADLSLEFGRINLRNGPAYGYNPTDFFRDGSQRITTSVDPIALRDNRMGTVALRAQRLWEGGGLGIVLAPKLTDNAPSRSGSSLDLGATNRSNRLLLTWSQQLPAGVSAQLLAFKQQDASLQFGANATALLGDALVAHAEWSGGRERSLASIASAGTATVRSQRAVAGLTWSPEGSWSITGEVQHNGFGLEARRWATLGPTGVATYLGVADQRQDLAARRALLVYLTKKNLALKNLELTALVRGNLDDHSRLAWIELRYVMPAVEFAVQWQQFSGATLTEFGTVPVRHALQALATYRF